MGIPAYVLDRGLTAFSSEIEAARQDLHHVDFFKAATSLAPPIDQLEVLRRWNSHTPMVTNRLGGGYFLRWRGKGIVIDPGWTFLDAFRSETEGLEGHRIGEIDMVIATHDHVDHAGDLGPLVILLRQYNKWRKSSPGSKCSLHRTDFIVSHGAYFSNQALFEHPQNRAFVRVSRVLPNRRVCPPRDRCRLDQRYYLELECLRTRHREILGDDTGFGLRLTLLSEDLDAHRFVICDTGDTAFDPDLLFQYEDADILILHLGTLERFDHPGEPSEHLCLSGVLGVLNGLKHPPHLAILGEWGEEFRHPKSRLRFTEYVKKYVEPRVRDSVAILPADLGMKVRIPDCHVAFKQGVTFKPARPPLFLPPAAVRIKDFGERLDYLT